MITKPLTRYHALRAVGAFIEAAMSVHADNPADLSETGLAILARERALVETALTWANKRAASDIAVNVTYSYDSPDSRRPLWRASAEGLLVSDSSSGLQGKHSDEEMDVLAEVLFALARFMRNVDEDGAS